MNVLNTMKISLHIKFNKVTGEMNAHNFSFLMKVIMIFGLINMYLNVFKMPKAC